MATQRMHLVVALALGTGACGEKTRDRSGVEALRASVAAFNRGDAAAATAPFAADVQWSLYGAGDGVVGRERLQEVWAGEIASEGIQLGLERVFVPAPDHFFAAGVMRGTYRGTEARPVEPRPIGMHYVTEYVVEDGAIAEVVQYGNAMALATQMGGLPGKPPPVPDLPAKTEVIEGASDADEASAARNVIVALARADWAAVRRACAEDLTFHDVANGRTHAGFEGRKGAWTDWAGAFPGATVSPEGVWSVGDWVLIRSRFEGSHEADLGGLAPTHRPVDLVSIDIMHFEDEHIATWWRYSNPMVLMIQLGLQPTAGVASRGEQP